MKLTVVDRTNPSQTLGHWEYEESDPSVGIFGEGWLHFCLAADGPDEVPEIIPDIIQIWAEPEEFDDDGEPHPRRALFVNIWRCPVCPDLLVDFTEDLI